MTKNIPHIQLYLRMASGNYEILDFVSQIEGRKIIGDYAEFKDLDYKNDTRLVICPQ